MVWSHLASYPFWPSIVCSDPDFNSYKRISNNGFSIMMYYFFFTCAIFILFLCYLCIIDVLPFLIVMLCFSINQSRLVHGLTRGIFFVK